MIIKGTGFVDGLTVTFGGLSATSIVVVDAFTIHCLTPAHAVGSVDVVITNPDGQAATLTNGFAYSTTWLDQPSERKEGTQPDPDSDLDDPLAPVVTSVNANHGTSAGGTKVFVIGANFVRGATVTFDGVAQLNVTYVNSKAISVVTKPHALGVVDVKVTNPDAQFGTLVAGYSYFPPEITLRLVTPDSGTTAGGTNITINGTGFVDPVEVLIGFLSATNVVVVNDQTITCTTPANLRGPAEIQVTNIQ